MKYVTLLAAVAIMFLSDTLGLLHAWMNRSGPVDADVTLTERELPLSHNSNNEDTGVELNLHNSNNEDTGLELNLRWIGPASPLFGDRTPSTWLGQSTLHDLGFDTKVAPSDRNAIEFYQRQHGRRVFVALEYDGPAWRKYRDLIDQEKRFGVNADLYERGTHLVAIDADIDRSRLRSRHPDRKMVIIVPAVVRIGVQPSVPANPAVPSTPASLYGSIEEVPSSIHVPRPFSEEFRGLPKGINTVSYRVHLRYGASLEPWVAGVEVPTHDNP